MTEYTEFLIFLLPNQRLKIKEKDLRVDVSDILKLVDCKMFSRRLLKLEGIHESLPTAW